MTMDQSHAHGGDGGAGEGREDGPTLLESAIGLAVSAHAGQTDRNGEPYILHPLRVMLDQVTDDDRIIAVLHDVVEDTTVTLDELADSFPSRIVKAIDVLTKRDGEDYDAYLDRVIADPYAMFVKASDLDDNMRPSRNRNLRIEDHRRLEKYGKARDRLQRCFRKAIEEWVGTPPDESA